LYDIAVVYASEALSQQLQPVESCVLLKTFLLLWKRLEVLKQQWVSNKLGVTSVETYTQYVSYWLVFGLSVFYLNLNLDSLYVEGNFNTLTNIKLYTYL